MAVPELVAVDLGRMAYGPALELQRAVARERVAGRLEEDVLLLVEHPPVVTLGRASHEGHVLATRDALAARGVEVFEVERGGDVTFHGPGQLVGYPILDLRHHRKDLHWYLRQVEEAIIRALAPYGLVAERNPGYTGVWMSGKGTPPSVERSGSPGPVSASEEAWRPVGDSGGQAGELPDSRGQSVSALRGGPAPRAHPRPSPPNGASEPGPGATRRKIASIGVHARDWITWHGFALNVSTDLSFFDLIVPCGISDVSMTSMARELPGLGPSLEEVTHGVAGEFAEVFNRALRWERRESFQDAAGFGSVLGGDA